MGEPRAAEAATIEAADCVAPSGGVLGVDISAAMPLASVLPPLASAILSCWRRTPRFTRSRRVRSI